MKTPSEDRITRATLRQGTKSAAGAAGLESSTSPRRARRKDFAPLQILSSVAHAYEMTATVKQIRFSGIWRAMVVDNKPLKWVHVTLWEFGRPFVRCPVHNPKGEDVDLTLSTDRLDNE